MHNTGEKKVVSYLIEVLLAFFGELNASTKAMHAVNDLVLCGFSFSWITVDDR